MLKKRAFVPLLLVLLSILALASSVMIPTELVRASPSSTVVGTSTDPYATLYPYQRKNFNAAGRFWVWYNEGASFVYRSSTDGVNWSDATSIGATWQGGFSGAIWFDGAYFHYVRFYSYDLYYRRGTPNSDGTITWCEDEQVVYDGTSEGSDFYYEPTIAVDSAGYAWIGAAYGYGAEGAEVFKNASTDGTWNTDTGFPYELKSGINMGTSVVPLTNSKVYAFYGKDKTYGYGKLWDGSSWGEEEGAMSDPERIREYSAVALGDDIHLVFLHDTPENGIVYNKRTYGEGWGDEVIVQATQANYYMAPVLCLDTATNNLYCFWAGSPEANKIYYKKQVSGSWDADPTTWLNETSDTLYRNDVLTCSYQAYGGKIGLLYTTKTVSPYNVKFAFLEFAVPQSASLSDPVEDGYIQWTSETGYMRINTYDWIRAGKKENEYDLYHRGYVEWDISIIPDGVTITNVVLKYHGKAHDIDWHIHEMVGTRPSTSAHSTVYAEAGSGTIYANPSGFPVEGTNKEIDLGVFAVTDLQNQLTSDWFAIGFQSDTEEYAGFSDIYAEEYSGVPPAPTLYVTWSILEWQTVETWTDYMDLETPPPPPEWQEVETWVDDMDTTLVIGPPTLVSPENNSTIYDNTPTFTWVVGANADNHRFLLDNDSDFSSTVENILLGVVTTYEITTPLADDNYWWKVIAEGDELENSSDVWTFELETPTGWSEVETWIDEMDTVVVPLWSGVELWADSMSLEEPPLPPSDIAVWAMFVMRILFIFAPLGFIAWKFTKINDPVTGAEGVAYVGLGCIAIILLWFIADAIKVVVYAL